MANKKRFYNYEKDTTETYVEVKKMEVVTVRNVTDLLVEHRYWKDSNGELWGDFDNPMENVYADFHAYRKKVGYMEPSEIKQLRKKLNLSTRSFADKIGISYTTLSNIENNHIIQNSYQNVLFSWSLEFYELMGNLPKSTANGGNRSIESFPTIEEYKKYLGYLSSNDIRTIRKKLNLDIRTFSKKLGISPATLDEIENNHKVQNRYQEILFEWANKFYEIYGYLPSKDDTELKRRYM